MAIPRERVLCIGTSMSGVLALLTGLSYGAGRIVVGAVPVRAGTALRALSPSHETEVESGEDPGDPRP